MMRTSVRSHRWSERRSNSSNSRGDQNLQRILEGRKEDIKIKEEPFDPEYDAQICSFSYDKIKTENAFQLQEGSTKSFTNITDSSVSANRSIKIEGFTGNTFQELFKREFGNNSKKFVPSSSSSNEHTISANSFYEGNQEQTTRLMSMLEATVEGIAAGKVTVCKTGKGDSNCNWEITSAEDEDLLMTFQFLDDDSNHVEKDKSVDKSFRRTRMRNTPKQNHQSLSTDVIVKTEIDLPEMLKIIEN